MSLDHDIASDHGQNSNNIKDDNNDNDNNDLSNDHDSDDDIVVGLKDVNSIELKDCERMEEKQEILMDYNNISISNININYNQLQPGLETKGMKSSDNRLASLSLANLDSNYTDYRETSEGGNNASEEVIAAPSDLKGMSTATRREYINQLFGEGK